MGEDLAARPVEGTSLSDHFGTLAQKLRDVRDAFDARDFVLLADILEFEMPEVCLQWSGRLGAFADDLRCAGGRMSAHPLSLPWHAVTMPPMKARSRPGLETFPNPRRYRDYLITHRRRSSPAAARSPASLISAPS